MKTENVPIARLVHDERYYPRHKIDSTYLRILAADWKDGADFPPIHVWRKNSSIVDGVNRVLSKRRAFGDEATIDVVFHDFADEREALRFAISSNARHGKRLLPIDWLHCVEVAKELGMTQKAVAEAFGVAPKRIMDLVRERMAEEKGTGDPVKLKPVAQPRWAGKEITPKARAANEHLDGKTQPVAYVNQLIALFEVDAAPHGDDMFAARLRHLAELIEEFLDEEQE